jgi:putative ABC transport system permease protein
MKLQLKIALRNVFRNKRRTGLTLLAIVFGAVAIIVFGGYAEQVYVGLRETTINSQLGHIQIFRQGYAEHAKREPESYLLDSETVKKVKDILEEIPEVQVVATRLNFSGLLSNGSTSIGVFGIGMEAELEAEMSSGLTIIKGEDLFADEEDAVLLGEGLAHTMEVQPGEVLTLLSSTADGAINALDVTVAGIFNTYAKEYDDRAMRMNLPHTKLLLYTDEVTRVVVLLKETAFTEKTASLLTARLKDAELEVEIKTWRDLADFYNSVKMMFGNLFGFIQIIVVVIVVLGIANTMMMTVMERTSEIGTIRALGTKKRGVMQLFLLEGLIIGVLGGLLGVFSGIGAAELISAMEIMMPPPPGASKGYPINIKIVPEVLSLSFGLAVVAALCSSFYPAFKASRLRIVDALRFV